MAASRPTAPSGWRCSRAAASPGSPASSRPPVRSAGWCRSSRTNYGFTAIIVAFLGRLHPVGVLIAGTALAITFVGGEVAQTTIRLPFAAVGIFQAMMLFLLLAGDVFVRYRFKRPAPEAARAPA